MPAMTVSLVSSSVDDAERRVFAAEALQGLAQLVGAVAVERRDRHLDDRLGHEHAFQRAVLRLGGVGVAAGAVDAHARPRCRRPRPRRFLRACRRASCTMRLKRSFLAGALVVVHLALVDRALVDAHERQLAERILDDLERHADERLGRIGRRAAIFLRRVVPFLALISRSSGEGR